MEDIEDKDLSYEQFKTRYLLDRSQLLYTKNKWSSWSGIRTASTSDVIYGFTDVEKAYYRGKELLKESRPLGRTYLELVMVAMQAMDNSGVDKDEAQETTFNTNAVSVLTDADRTARRNKLEARRMRVEEEDYDFVFNSQNMGTVDRLPMVAYQDPPIKDLDEVDTVIAYLEALLLSQHTGYTSVAFEHLVVAFLFSKGYGSTTINAIVKSNYRKLAIEHNYHIAVNESDILEKAVQRYDDCHIIGRCVASGQLDATGLNLVPADKLEVANKLLRDLMAIRDKDRFNKGITAEFLKTILVFVPLALLASAKNDIQSTITSQFGRCQSLGTGECPAYVSTAILSLAKGCNGSGNVNRCLTTYLAIMNDAGSPLNSTLGPIMTIRFSGKGLLVPVTFLALKQILHLSSEETKKYFAISTMDTTIAGVDRFMTLMFIENGGSSSIFYIRNVANANPEWSTKQNRFYVEVMKYATEGIQGFEKFKEIKYEPKLHSGERRIAKGYGEELNKMFKPKNPIASSEIAQNLMDKLKDLIDVDVHEPAEEEEVEASSSSSDGDSSGDEGVDDDEDAGNNQGDNGAGLPAF